MTEKNERTKEDVEWQKLRRQVLKRDGYHCRVFGCPVRGAAHLTCHHIIPRDEGGDNDTRNLITLCAPHHDQIEVSGIRQLAQVVNWSPDVADMSTVTLDTLESNEDIDTNCQASFSASSLLRPPRRSEAIAHHCAEDTVTAIRLLHEGHSSWVDVALLLHYDPALAPTLSAIARDVPGVIADAGEDDLRLRIEDYAPEWCTWHNQVATSGTLHVESPKQATYPIGTEAHLLRVQQAVLTCKNGRTWRALADELQVSHAVLHFIGTAQWNHVAWENVRLVCRRLCLPDPGPLIATVGCPTCGEPHLAGDCHGVPVAAVVCLAPGATIRKPAPLPTRWRDYSTAELARIFAARQDYYGTPLA